jgi:ABC-2 type transport system permease protein/lipopolysaccharide transport system permease protein
MDQALILPDPMVEAKAASPAQKPAPEKREIRGSPVKLFQLISDFYSSLKRSGFWLYSSWIEILLSYRSTILGPLWILIGTLTFVFFVGILYGRVVLNGQSNVYMAHLAVGFTIWYFITQSLVASCHFFSSNRADILDGDTDYTDLILKLITKNAIDFLHSSPAIVIAFVTAELMPTPVALAIVLTLPLMLINLLWMCTVLSILGARFPDLQEFTQSSLRLLFFLTPIMWVAQQHLKGPFIDALLYFNPFYYFIEVIRAPLVYGEIPYFEIVILSVAMPIGWLCASLLYARTRAWLALWL